MEALILDKDFETIFVLDIFESFIWTDRYRAYGDFELYLPMSKEMFSLLEYNLYVYNKESEHLMIIEDKVIDTDAENNAWLKVTGSSLESILKRRIVWSQTRLKGNLQDKLEKLFEDNIIKPKNADRKIENFVFEKSDDEVITQIKIDKQYTGDNFYDLIVDLCDEFDLGFKITLNKNKQFVFKLYKGVDRSYEQTERPYVVFSPNFDNLLNTKYYGSIINYKNIALVAGEGQGSSRKTRTVGSAEGLERRELFVDARDLSSDGVSGAAYNKKLDQRGIEKLMEYALDESFEGGTDPTIIYVYGEDYFLGDTVQIMNEWNIEAVARIDEIIFSQDTTGYTAIPSFTVVQESNFMVEDNEEEDDE